MCSAGRGVVDMSRISNRASTIAAILSILLLVAFLVVLWTGIRTSNGRASGIETFDGFWKEILNETTTGRAVFDEDNFSNEGRISFLFSIGGDSSKNLQIMVRCFGAAFPRDSFN